MNQAKIIKVGNEVAVQTPYNAELVKILRGIPGRHWSSIKNAWFVPAGSEQQVRELVRQFYQIEDEHKYGTPYEIVHVRVTGKSASSRYPGGGVTVDGQYIIDPSSGFLDTRPNGAFEIIDYKGGFVSHGSEYVFAVEYDLRLQVRKGAVFEATGYGEYRGSYEFVTETRSALEDEVADILAKMDDHG